MAATFAGVRERLLRLGTFQARLLAAGKTRVVSWHGVSEFPTSRTSFSLAALRQPAAKLGIRIPTRLIVSLKALSSKVPTFGAASPTSATSIGPAIEPAATVSAQQRAAMGRKRAIALLPAA